MTEEIRTEMLNDEVIVEVIDDVTVDDVKETLMDKVLHKLNFKVIGLVGGGIAIVYIGKKRHWGEKIWSKLMSPFGGARNIFKNGGINMTECDTENVESEENEDEI